jgi:hypothetical protein
MRAIAPICSRLAITPLVRVHSYTACIDERRRKSAEPWRSHDGATKPSIDCPIRAGCSSACPS